MHQQAGAFLETFDESAPRLSAVLLPLPSAEGADRAMGTFQQLPIPLSR